MSDSGPAKPESASGTSGATPVVPVVPDAANSTTPEPTTEPSAGNKTLTNKELKELKKQEKAAKRAAAKAVAGGGTAEVATRQEAAAALKAAAGKAKTSSNIKKQMDQAKIVKEDKKKIPALFGHLDTREQRNSSSPYVASVVHPSILSLSLKFSTYRIVGSTPRCVAMLEAFKDVISSYTTPDGTSLSRNLTSHLSHQIEYLKTSRPLSVSMGNSIRWLKQEISLISIDTSDEVAKNSLIEKIDQFISEKIVYSDRVIVQSASNHIKNGDTVLTYGHSEVLKKLFIYCAEEENKDFTVVCVDSKPLFEGKRLAKELCNRGLKCQYGLISGLTTVMKDVDTVFLGAHAMLSNGRLYSRVGTALIAMSAKRRNIPVLVCCESLKFSDKVQLDSVTLNELGDSEDMLGISGSALTRKGFALQQFISQKKQEQASTTTASQKKNSGNTTTTTTTSTLTINELKDPVLSNWKDIPKLNILNIMYDLTQPECIKKIITELGALPPSSVPVILREYKSTV
ncbi:unnamed protein product [Kuraishia capsulata CBS 1993]|uniref:Translation initiation factor eIF2B subunit delta n=1 Tax=Kuraishia capsulata CBS 1993 TaxID=1382522 RepID=W6MTT8_9ASCO|nr:uncharacterized protein KUCA_T00004646001 [Kuraishia capsulata CBS 1993]CDK28662.1 unnamed protein product [Kuraishia capsulata CBS 1993]